MNRFVSPEADYKLTSNSELLKLNSEFVEKVPFFQAQVLRSWEGLWWQQAQVCASGCMKSHQTTELQGELPLWLVQGYELSAC